MGTKNLREVHVPEWMEQQTFPGEVCRVHAVCGCWSIPVEKHSEKDQGEGHQHCWKLRDGNDDGSRLEWGLETVFLNHSKYVTEKLT